MENPTHNFRQTNLALQLIQESRNKSTGDELEPARENRAHFGNAYFVRRKFL